MEYYMSYLGSVKNFTLPITLPFPGVSGNQSTSSSAYVSIGVIPFDASQTGTPPTGVTRSLKFACAIEVSSPGVTGSIRLYNLNTGAAVTGTTLTSTSAAESAPEGLISSSLTVGSSPNIVASLQLYEVQLKMNGGTGTDLVTCKVATLLGSWA